MADHQENQDQISDESNGEEDEGIVSEVHILSGLTDHESETNFRFKPPVWLRSSEVFVDEDGDLDVVRETKEHREIKIKHLSRSNLSEVGSQVWQGALFMADYLLSHPNFVYDKNVLEIGAGTGLTSIVAALCKPKSIVSSDLAQCVDRLKHNIAQNSGNFGQTQVECLELDICNSLQEHDPVTVTKVHNADLVVAADMIYDDALTEALIDFFTLLLENSRQKPQLFLLTIEKRFVFTIRDLDTRPYAYDVFTAKLETAMQSWKKKRNVSIQELNSCQCDQYFCYKRSEDLVLVKLEIKPNQ